MSGAPPPRKRKGVDELRDLKASLTTVETQLKTAAAAAPESELTHAVHAVVRSLPLIHRFASHSHAYSALAYRDYRGICAARR